MDILAAIAAKMAVSILEFLLARHDLKESVRKEIQLAVQERIVNAFKWSSSHPDPGGLHDAGGSSPSPDPDSFKPSK